MHAAEAALSAICPRTIGAGDAGAGPGGAGPYHPRTLGRIERWHQTRKNRVLPEIDVLQGDLDRRIQAFGDGRTHRRDHERLGNLTPADADHGRGAQILSMREEIKTRTRRLQNRNAAHILEQQANRNPRSKTPRTFRKTLTAGNGAPDSPFAVADHNAMSEAARVHQGRLDIRSANGDDIRSLVALYADDDLGKTREASGADPAYLEAFAAIEADPNHILAVGALNGVIVATLLLSFLPGLSRRGAWRAQIESMRVAQTMRGHGLGQEMLDWAIATARARGCTLLQLTSDRRRPDAHRFYERAGFHPTHLGFKLDLGAT